MAKLSGVDIHDFGTTFKAYRREVIHNISLYGEMHRFIPALAASYGASICEIPISNVHRQKGRSHYGIGRTFRVFFDLLTIRFLLRYMTRPLHFFGIIGALGILGGGAVSAFLLALKIFTHQHVMDEHGPLFVVAAVLILAGTQLLAIGLLGELQERSALRIRSIDWCACVLRKSQVCFRRIKVAGAMSRRCGNRFILLLIDNKYSWCRTRD